MLNFEVAISGIAGAFPECMNVQQLEERMFNDETFITGDESKWLRTHEVPLATGKMKECFRFDQTFFGIHRKLCVVMDSHAKHSIERTYEAICDAGVNPTELYGQDIAVLMASMTSETEYGSVMVSKTSGHAMLGHSRCMQANRISYFFDFKGPSLAIDSSWVGPLQVLEMAHNLVAKGHVKAAVVGASNMIFNPEVSVHYDGLCKLSKDGKTKSFSADADGYVRSEGVIVFFIQRKEDALRSYGSLVKVMCKTEMMEKAVFPDHARFNNFLRDFYSNVPIKNSEIAYIEGDGSASVPADAMELNALAEVLCPGREKPLLVSCCKPKTGHLESSAALMSIVTALIAMKTGYIPPCLDHSGPNPLVPALRDGRIKIVTEKTPLEGDYVGVTAMGLVSIYGHVLLKRNPKTWATPIDRNYFPKDGIPRLLLLSGRDEVPMKEILKRVETQPIDEGYYMLNNRLFKTSFNQHLYRGYCISGEGKCHSEIAPYQGGAKKQVWYIFSGMGSQWAEMGVGVMKIPVMKRAIERCHRTLVPKGIDLISLITNPDPSVYDDILHCFVGIAAIQIGLVDLLEEIGITPDGVVGHSVGELGCSYADKCLTAEQVILAAYARGKASNDAKLIKGMMAAVGKGYKEMKDLVPDDIEVACHNSSTSCTLSGPVEKMETYVAELKKEGVFAKLVNVANIAYHSRNIAPAAPLLLNYLKEIIPDPKPRSSKWVSSSVPEDRWDTELAKFCSAEYHTNNLLSYVLFEEATSHIPDNVICIEIAPHGLLQAIVKRSLPTSTNIALTSRFKGEGCSFLIEALGKLWSIGVEMDLTQIYPKLEVPLPRETEYLHPLLTWDHTEVWIPLTLQMEVIPGDPNLSWKDVELFSSINESLILATMHRMFGKAVYPRANLLTIIMEFMSEKLKDKVLFKFYEFQNLKFKENLVYDKDTETIVQILYQIGYGNFECSSGGISRLTGQLIPRISPIPPVLKPDVETQGSQATLLTEDNIYSFFQDNDYIFTDNYRNIINICISKKGFVGKVMWRGNQQLYLDAILKLIIFYWSLQNDVLVEIDSIKQFIVDQTALPQDDKDVEVIYESSLQQLTADGILMYYIKTRPVREKSEVKIEVGLRDFVPYSTIDFKDDFLKFCLQLITECPGSIALSSVQVIANEESSFFKNIFGSKYFNSMIKSKTNIRLWNSKDIQIVANIESDRETSGCNFAISENSNMTEALTAILKSAKPCYVMQMESAGTDNAMPKQLVPIFQQNYGSYQVTFYKKIKNSLETADFIEMKDGNQFSNKAAIDETEFNQLNFLVYKYNLLSDISNTLESYKSIIALKFMRFVFLDKEAPPFDPSKPFYYDQLVKDLKFNVCRKGIWGSLREISVYMPDDQGHELFDCKMPLNRLTCKKVDVKILSINLQNIALPSSKHKFGIMEYSGVMGGDLVFGLAKLSEDNFLEVDPTFCWKKPVEWTMHQAATVPLFYCMAYYLLYIKSKYTNRPYESVLIHGGQTSFSQAVINVAIGLKVQIFTTCFTQIQKELIMKKFPQIKEKHIYVISGRNRFKFVDGIMEETEGDGVKVVIDCLDDPQLKVWTIQSVGNMGRYFLVCHNSTEAEQTFGMSIFMKEAAAIGFNHEQIFEMDAANKKILIELVEAGIKTHIVKPLNNLLIKDLCSRERAVETVVSASQLDEPMKVLIPVESGQIVSVPGPRTKDNRTYLIIGSYNSLWFDVMNWLGSKGAENIFIVLNKGDIPKHLLIRVNTFVRKHNNMNVQFFEKDLLNTAQSCEKLVQQLQSGHTIDKVFYVKPGFENQLSYVDFALRKNSKTCRLVCIGLNECGVTEKRRFDGLNGDSFVLKGDLIKNITVIKVLDNWWLQETKNQVITLEEIKVREDNSIILPEILPTNKDELVELGMDSVSRPTLVETSTNSLPYVHTKDLNPVFIFPGFKIPKIKSIVSKMIYPVYIAKYPSVVASLNEIASSFSEELINNFDLNMFTLIGEGWTGPLVLKMAEILENRGRIAEIILLDASPSTLKMWSKNIAKCNSVISKYIPAYKENEEITLENLKGWRDTLSDMLYSNTHSKEDIRKGLNTMINRLEVIDTFNTSCLSIKSPVHLFTPSNIKVDISDLQEMCEIPCTHHVVEGTTPESFLESPSLQNDLRSLVLLEYKMCARKQDVPSISTLELILDNKYNADSLLRL